MYDEASDIRFVQFREMTKLDQQPAEIAETPAKDLIAALIGQFRQDHSEILHAGLALSPCQMKPRPGQNTGSTMGHAARQHAEESKQRAGECVFDEVFNASAHP
jgi:hypothetical protein